MKGKDLLKFLSELSPEDLERPIILNIEYGRGCSMVVTDVDVGTSSQYDPDTNEEYDCISIGGDEDDRYCE